MIGGQGVAGVGGPRDARACASPLPAGTPQYMAGEVWRGGHYSFSADMWALGCVAYELCALRPAFEAPTGEWLGGL